MFANRLKKRFRHLKKYAKRAGTEAFRLYDRDIPEIPLVLDLWGDVVSGALYKRPYEKDEAEETVWLDEMRSAAAESLGIEIANIIIKRRERQRGPSQYEKISGEGLTRTVIEGGLKFKVNLSDYLDTGLFLDKRSLRAAVRAMAEKKRVLNLFCYTASFSVYAADGEACSTDSVDLSNTYLRIACENFSLNGFHTATLRQEDFFSRSMPKKIPSCSHRLIRSDVQLFLRQAQAAALSWDIIILDPPAFSNSSMAVADLDLRRDYGELLANCLALLCPGGSLWFSTGARSFKATAADIEIMLAEQFPGLTVSDKSRSFIDEDFKGKKTPKMFLLHKGNERGKTGAGTPGVFV